MTISLLIIGIILGVIGALVTLILSIVHLAGGKSRSGIILGVSFIMSVIIVVLSIVETIKRGSNKIKEGVEWVKEQGKNNNSTWSSHYDKHNSNSYYAFIPEGNKDSISPKFYDARDNNNYCIPLVYPYRFNSEDNMIMTYASLERFNTDKKDSCLKDLRCISGFTFDDKLLLAKRDNNEMMRVDGNKKSDLPDYTYFLFDFATGKCRAFMNEDRMMDEAEKRGFNGQKYMDFTYTHYWNYSGSDGD